MYTVIKLLFKYRTTFVIYCPTFTIYRPSFVFYRPTFMIYRKSTLQTTKIAPVQLIPPFPISIIESHFFFGLLLIIHILREMNSHHP